MRRARARRGEDEGDVGHRKATLVDVAARQPDAGVVHQLLEGCSLFGEMPMEVSGAHAEMARDGFL